MSRFVLILSWILAETISSFSVVSVSSCTDSYFRSQEAIAISAETARAAFQVGDLKFQEQDSNQTQEAWQAMKALDVQELELLRVRKGIEADPDSFALQANSEMNVRVMVAARALLWRKAGIWSEMDRYPSQNGNPGDSLLPSVSHWLGIVQRFVDELEKSEKEYQIQLQKFHQHQQQYVSSYASSSMINILTIKVPTLSISLEELNSHSSHLNLLSQMAACMKKEAAEELKNTGLANRLHAAIGKHLEIRRRR